MTTKKKRRRAPARSGTRRAAPDIERITGRDEWRPDMYHRFLTMHWSMLFAVLAIAYIVFNVVFATLYWLQPGSIANEGEYSFLDSFFFSVQTMATIGYGDMRPATLYANLLVTVEVLCGMTGLAIATGLVFSRFARPTARVMFSSVAVVTPHDGVRTLMIRAANRRSNQIAEAQVSLAMLSDEVSREGLEMRRFHTMHVARARTPAFALSWTIMHPIDEASPLHGATAESLQRINAEIVVSISGLDETFSQTIHARHSYRADDIHWDRRFADIIGRAADGRRVIDYRLFHDTVAS